MKSFPYVTARLARSSFVNIVLSVVDQEWVDCEFVLRLISFQNLPTHNCMFCKTYFVSAIIRNCITLKCPFNNLSNFTVNDFGNFIEKKSTAYVTKVRQFKCIKKHVMTLSTQASGFYCV